MCLPVALHLTPLFRRYRRPRPARQTVLITTRPDAARHPVVLSLRDRHVDCTELALLHCL